MKIIVGYLYSEKLKKDRFIKDSSTEVGYKTVCYVNDLTQDLRALFAEAVFVNQGGGTSLLTEIPEKDHDKLKDYWQCGDTIEAHWPEELVDNSPRVINDDIQWLLKKNLELKPAIHAALENLKQREAEKKNEEIATYAADISNFLCLVEGRWDTQALRHVKHREDPRVQEALARAEENAKKRNEAKAKAEAEKAAKLTAWIGEYAPVLLERHTEGLLPQDELKDYARSHLFEPIEGFDRYERLSSYNFSSNDCYEHDAKFDVDTAKTLTASEFDRLKAIRAAMPGAEVEARVHTVSCSRCGGSASRTSALVSVEWMDFTLSREYALSRQR